MSYDTFTRSDSAVTLGNTETGQAWSVSAGTTWGVSGGKAYCPTLGSPSIWPGPGGHAFIDIGTADMVVEALITAMGSTASTCYGIVARYQDAQNCWVAFVINSAGTPLVYCGVVVAGAVTYSVANGVALSGSGPWLLKIAAKGDSVTLFVDGVVKGTVASSSFDTQTKAGMMVGNAGATQALIENWGAAPYPVGSGSSIYRQILADSPTAYWPMDEASGSFADMSGNAHTLTPTGVSLAQALPSGPFASAPHWNGTSASASVALDLSALTAITIACWLSWDAFANNDSLLWEHSANYNSVKNGFICNPNDSAAVKLTTALHGIAGSGSGTEYNDARVTRPTAGAWHHWAVVYDLSAAAASMVTPYLDGVAATYVKNLSYAASGNFLNSTLFVGSRNNASLFAAMYMRHLAVIPRALSAARIGVHYRAGVRSGAVGP